MTLGQQGEELVAEEYQKLGYTIIGRNVRLHDARQTGEFDIIAVRDRQLVFVEVKTRRSNRYGSGAEAVDWVKQRRLVKSARMYLYKNPQFDQFDLQIDVAVVDVDNSKSSVIMISNAIEEQ